MRKLHLDRVTRASGGSCAPEIEVKRAPAHARGLRVSERFAFVVMFSLMAAFVVGLTMLAVKSGARALTGHSSPASSKTLPAGVTGKAGRKPSGVSRTTGTGTPDSPAGVSPASVVLDARLAAAVQAATGSDPGRISVGVIDTATGAKALYRAGMRYQAASIVKADILAALLFQHQRARTPLTAADAGLAAAMIKNSSDSAATQLWEEIGGGQGITVANKALNLQHTIPGTAASWGLTRTTAADQLQLLADLTGTNSALDSTGRAYELSLLADVAVSQRWGVPAAATPGASYAVKDGVLPDPTLWVINSIGVIRHDGHVLLIAILSKGNPTEADGIASVRAAAIAAASVITKAAD